MTPVFKNGKLNPIIKNPDKMIQLCMQNVGERQNALVKQYHLDQLKGYALDEDKGTLRFLLNDESQLEFEVVPAGVWNSKTNQWIWGWSSSEMGAALFARSASLKGLSNIIDSTDFTDAIIDCDANKSQMISVLATEFLGGSGRFIAPQGDFRMHFVLMKKNG